MKTHKFYLEASDFFISNLHYSSLNTEEKEYSHFASVLLSWISLESFVNAISKGLSNGTRLKPHEKVFLEELEYRVNDKGELKTTSIRPSTTKKILFILNYFSKKNVSNFRKTKLWRDLKCFEDLRNRIVHHKEISEIRIDINKTLECKNIVKDTITYLRSALK